MEQQESKQLEKARGVAVVSGTLAERFEERAKERPWATALSCGEQSLSYGELSRRANRVAWRLRAEGVGPETIVGLSAERTLGMVVGLLGIAKAGGAYLPLDASYPSERRRYMLEDAGAKVVLTDGSGAEWLPEDTRRVALDEHDVGGAESAPESGATAENAAYVMYTSGTTGRPKGTVVTHGNVLRLFDETRDWFGGFGEDEVWTLFHSMAFDISVWELWGGLLHGGRVVVVPYWVSRAPEQMYDLLEREGVTLLSQTATAFRQLQQVDEQAHRAGRGRQLKLKWVVFVGEALDPSSLKGWRGRHAAELVDMYGPTETTVYVMYCRLTEQDLESSSCVIGVGFRDVSLRVLDEQMAAVPLGLIGELYVGGAGVSRGYLGRPELTAERFVPDPWGTAGGRLYRTGDRVRWRSDGRLEYLGRGDDQVKIRGFRVELGEIEAALRQSPEVADAAVLAKAGKSGDQRLLGYVVAKEAVPRESSAAAGELLERLRQRLEERLPSYMVPKLMLVPQLPLTENGKLDRRALPEPGSAEQMRATEYVAPRTPDEHALAEIWSEVLGVERVGIHDSFIELGGDSISGIRAVVRARDAGLNLEIADVLGRVSLERLAELVCGAGPGPSARGPLLAEFALVNAADRERLPSGVVDAYPLSALQAGMLFHSEYSADTAIYHDILSFHTALAFDRPAFERALARIVDEHPMLRTSFDLVSFTDPLQLVWRQVTLPLTVCDLRSCTPEEAITRRAEMLERERTRPLAWDVAPITRVLVAVHPEGGFRVTLSLHHAILDGWSFAVLIRDLLHHYERLLRGEPSPARVHSLRFSDYVAAEANASASASSAEFWRATLAGCVPQYVPRKPNRSAPPSARRVRSLEVRGVAERMPHLVDLSRKLGVPLKTLLLTAHLRVLALISGRRDVVTGLLTSGRTEDSESERAVGLFLNTLPLRARLADGQTCAQWVWHTFELERALLPHRRYNLGLIQQQNGGSDLFDVAFNYVHFHVLADAARRLGCQLNLEEQIIETNFALVVEGAVDVATGQLSVRLWHDTTALDHEQVSAIAATFSNVLDELLGSPGLPLAPLDEDLWRTQQRLLARSTVPVVQSPGASPSLASPNTASRRTVSRSESMPALEAFRRLAAESPDLTAIVDERGSYTYGHLARRANQLSRHLSGGDVTPGDTVAICLERSFQMVAAVIATLQIGAAYLPLDPAYPPQRLTVMLEDARAKLIVTETAVADALPGDGSTPSIRIDADAAQIAGEPSGDVAVSVEPGDIAYVIYTSGSSGRPKGVEMTHACLAELIAWRNSSMTCGPGARTLQFAALSFDVSYLEIFSTLSSGGVLVLPLEEQRRDSEALAALLANQRVESAILPVSVLHGLARAVEAGAPRPIHLRDVVCTGEALHVTPAVRRFFQGLSAATLENMYGPSETHVVTAHRLTGDPSQWPEFPPIGCAVAGACLYVVDALGRPVPPWVPGELWVGGVAVARGYRKSPDRTATRFIPDAQVADSSRIYRTGDQVAYGDDGTLYFLGRLDDQAKVRGYRVEPGEVEAMLARCSGVRASAVVVARGPDGNAQLVAHVLADEVVTSSEVLREQLASELPEYMVPSAIILRQTLPLTPSGKVDRRALAADVPVRRGASEPAHETATALERVIASVFRELLELPDMRAHDDFFAAGAQSLTLVRAVARVREALRVALPLRVLFRARSAAAIARYLRERTSDAAGLEAIAELYLEVNELGDDDVVRLLSDLSRESSQEEWV